MPTISWHIRSLPLISSDLATDLYVQMPNEILGISGLHRLQIQKNRLFRRSLFI
ncbi:hypothetical protein VCHA34P116_10693 [Vibrio chagasii]|nr:hypothetical protein VCHA35O137_10434 [Vibrio chagasii]CAH6850713.1 hypothetical protein VCHA32P90_10692 [Vibrio chagasii]CAH6855574.1 hypothetical protein VCHA34P116_10693 [Vibrio chagasii]CAH7051147.1 hypothetical protein VCHA39P230_10434 [Vibrio chagasii]CAH7100174.1 hypothetical protein VCHA53O469_10691 [Vibrio chagasii]